jgi:hypothetical protein
MAHPYTVVPVNPNPRRILGVTEDAGDDDVESAYAWLESARDALLGPDGL